MSLKFEVLNEKNQLVCQENGQDEVNLVVNNNYQEGYKIRFTSSEINTHIWLQLDDALGKSLVYMKKNELVYPIPFGEKRSNMSPKVFSGNQHLLYARVAKNFEINQYRNLCLNVNDYNGDVVACYPHASANIETRGEVVFAARNVIDGVTANLCHGCWPYQSWGINQRADALIKIEFGRKVKIDRIILYTRADFPHDNWWEQGTFAFSDGSEMVINMEKSYAPHEFTFESKEVEWITFDRLIKSQDESPFPALSQMEVYGV